MYHVVLLVTSHSTATFSILRCIRDSRSFEIRITVLLTSSVLSSQIWQSVKLFDRCRQMRMRNARPRNMTNLTWSSEYEVFRYILEEPTIVAELVHLKERSTPMGPEPAMDYVCRAVWGMLYTDDACIVLRLPQELAKMTEVIIEVCRAFALTVSAKKTDTMCMPPPRTPRTMVRIEAAGQIYKQVQSFSYLGGAVTETPDMSVEIARRTRACWTRITRYIRELYDQPKVALSYKTRMVKAEATEALLYGCSMWTLRQEHYPKLRTVHHQVLLRIIGRSARDQTTDLVQPCP